MMWAVWVGVGAAGGIIATLFVVRFLAAPSLTRRALDDELRALASSPRTRQMTVAELWALRRRQQEGDRQ
jgi:hypothetical protein